MDTKSKIHEALATLGIGTHSSQIEELVADALNELAALQQDRAVGAKLRMLLGANEGEGTVDALQRYTAAVQLGCALKLEQRAKEVAAQPAILPVPKVREVTVAALIGGATLLRQEVGAETGQQPTRYPCSATCTHDDAAKPGHPERVKERSEAVKEEMFNAQMNKGLNAAHEQGAEAMRAACLEAVRCEFEMIGELYSALYDRVKAAIEGAAP